MVSCLHTLKVSVGRKVVTHFHHFQSAYLVAQDIAHSARGTILTSSLEGSWREFKDARLARRERITGSL